MQLLANWTIQHQGVERRIELYQGDLSCLPPEHAVDVLVVSAFQNDYLPTPTSLIGALQMNDISVARLSLDKERDMRRELSCWISKRVTGTKGFNRILCIESGWRGTPPEIVDDIFRALAPCSIEEFPDGTVAMPLIGTSDQGYLPEKIMEATLRAAVFWFRHGLNISVLKIVVHSNRTALIAQETFLTAKAADSSQISRLRDTAPSQISPESYGEIDPCEVFVSYSHEDSETALEVVNLIRQCAPRTRIFFDRDTLNPGDSWLMQIAESLDEAKLIIAIYTPHYWASRFCKDEFVAAFMRQNDSGKSLLFPLYYRTSTIPYLFRKIQFADCREGDASRLNQACRALGNRLAS